jgi:hypothetical protein
MRTILRYFFLLSLFLSASSRLLAQATATGNIIGVVTDATGAALPAATVTATNQGTNAKRTTTTNNAGQYRFDLMPNGIYNVKAEAPGFSTVETKGLELSSAPP